jgi:lycopene cyclase domain-containing protein
MVTYLTFLAAFVCLPLSVLAVGSVLTHRPDRAPVRLQAGGLALMIGLALVYTTPWDNYLIGRGVWFYGDGVVTTRLWLMPLGEYLFVALQSILVGLWVFARDGPVDGSIGHTWPDRVGGAVAGLAVSGVGLAFVFGPTGLYYLGAILAWAGPVLALQWGVGWRYLLAVRRRLAVMVAVPALYLSTIDRIAIEMGLWTISSTYSTGVFVGGLPIEEGAFFLVTSLFLAQALVLLRWVVVRWG